MPGLMRGVARTAVIAGTATHVSNNVSRRQNARQAQQQAATAPEPQQNNVDDQMSQLMQLGKLRDQGVLTEAEFNAKKAQILGL